MRACVRACKRVRVCVCACEGVHVCVCECIVRGSGYIILHVSNQGLMYLWAFNTAWACNKEIPNLYSQELVWLLIRVQAGLHQRVV